MLSEKGLNLATLATEGDSSSSPPSSPVKGEKGEMSTAPIQSSKERYANSKGQTSGRSGVIEYLRAVGGSRDKEKEKERDRERESSATFASPVEKRVKKDVLQPRHGTMAPFASGR